MGRSGRIIIIKELYCLRCRAPIRDGIFCTWQCGADGVPVSERAKKCLQWRKSKVTPMVEVVYEIDDAFWGLRGRKSKVTPMGKGPWLSVLRKRSVRARRKKP